MKMNRVRLFCATRIRLGDEAEVITASDLWWEDGGRWRIGVQVGVTAKIIGVLVEFPVGIEVATGAEPHHEPVVEAVVVTAWAKEVLIASSANRR